jgi:hypothetical protein
MHDTEFLHMIRQQAKADMDGYRKGLKWMKEPESIEDHKNDIKVSEEHPYWHGDKEGQERALAIIEGYLELAKIIMPKKMPRAREAKA